jgi:hypothetical protein
MAALDNTRAISLLGGILALNAWPTVPTANKIRLGTTAPTATAAMTELSGTGYTTGGSTIAWGTVSGSPATSTNSGAITWTNTSGSSWSIVGAETWDTATTPLRWLFGSWNGQPIAVANNNAFQLAAGGASASLS